MTIEVKSFIASITALLTSINFTGLIQLITAIIGLVAGFIALQCWMLRREKNKIDLELSKIELNKKNKVYQYE